MGNKKLRERGEIDARWKWNISAMYADAASWEADLQQADAMTAHFADWKGRLAESPQTLAQALRDKDAIWQTLERVYVYARMRLDEDNRVSAHQAMVDRVSARMAKVSAAMSFFEPELLAIPEDVLRGWMDAAPELAGYRYLLETALREKQHILTPSEEEILAQFSEITDATHSIFTVLNNADLRFAPVTDADGDTAALTHGNYITFLESPDRRVREETFTHMYQTYQSLIHTLAQTYSYQVRTDVIQARVRRYPSARAAALAGGNIPTKIYDNLISVVHRNLPVLHRYLALRKRLLGVEDLHMYDVYVPLIQVPERVIPFSEAVSIMEQGLAPLGADYVARAKAGVAAGWIDVCENIGKTSGAYSFGAYDSAPYILLNYTDTLQDVFTLVHEMGHSMHASYTRETQPFVYGGHAIFTAEVASTVNESLLIRHLLATETDPQMRKYLLCMHIEAFRTTLFRQTMFAEFELLAHRYVEEDGSLTAQWLCETYEDLNRQYFGPALSPDPYIQYEWARIPHFYHSFYVYQYATGYAAATAISQKLLTEGAPARDAYLAFLRSGESADPVDLLRLAGVDMCSEAPLSLAMETFGKLVEELETLV